VLDAALVVDEPLGERAVPDVLDARARGVDVSDGVDVLLRIAPAERDQLQAPGPVAGVGGGQEATAVETCTPLLPGVVSAEVTGVRVIGEGGVAAGFVRRADAGSV